MEPPIGAFISATAAFPEITPNVDTLRELLATLDRREVLFLCARLNLIVSDQLHLDPQEMPWKQRESRLQSELANGLFSATQIEQINAHIRRFRIPDGDWILVFRGQLLELIRWACRFCQPKITGQDLLGNADAKEAFAKALLIASDLWNHRVYGDGFSTPEDLEDRRMKLLPRFRESHSETVAGPDLTRAFVRERAIICEWLPSVYPSFPDKFLAHTQLSLDQYYLCLMTVLLRSLGLDSAGGTQRVAVQRFFNRDTFYKEAPNQQVAFNRFLDVESQTIGELADRLWPNPTADNIHAAGFDRNVIRLRPIIRDEAGWAIVVDPVLFAEKAAVGPLFKVLGDHAARAFRRFGKAAEKYFHQLLRGIYPKPNGGLYDQLACPLMGLQGRRQEVEIADAAVDYGRDVVLMEHKAVWVHESASGGDAHLYAEHLRDKYEIAQLPTNIRSVASGAWTAREMDFSQMNRIFPVLVTYDYRMEAPLHPRFFAMEFANVLSERENLTLEPIRVGNFLVPPLILMTIDDLELLENSSENFSLRDLLVDYSEQCMDRQTSLKNFLAMSGKYRERIVYPYRVRENFSKELRALESKLFGSDSNRAEPSKDVA